MHLLRPDFVSSSQLRMRLCLARKENNWIVTVPGKSWNTILRLSGPLETWFNRTWRPEEIEPVQRQFNLALIVAAQSSLALGRR